MQKIKIRLLYEEMIYMIKKIAWNTFKNTGDINTILEFMKVEDIENQIIKAEQYGNIKDKGDSNIRK